MEIMNARVIVFVNLQLCQMEMKVKVKYETLMYLGQYGSNPTQFDNEQRCEMAYELLWEALKLIPTTDENEHVAAIYRGCRDEIEAAMEGIS